MAHVGMEGHIKEDTIGIHFSGFVTELDERTKLPQVGACA